MRPPQRLHVVLGCKAVDLIDRKALDVADVYFVADALLLVDGCPVGEAVGYAVLLAESLGR